jgi:hypothetical protein
VVHPSILNGFGHSQGFTVCLRVSVIQSTRAAAEGGGGGGQLEDRRP